MNCYPFRFICPGWRMGWITIHDRDEIFQAEIRAGLNSLSQRILGPNALIQGALSTILTAVPQSFFDDIIRTIEVCLFTLVLCYAAVRYNYCKHRSQFQTNAILAFEALRKIPGLRPIMPAGAMYMMTSMDMECFPGFNGNDLTFTSQLVNEESVFCLPGQVITLTRRYNLKFYSIRYMNQSLLELLIR